jgi:hypothetical protein
VTLNNVKASAPTPAEAQLVQDMIDRVSQLPLYCLRPKTDTRGTPCGSDAHDVKTTDPGRALVTGLIADAGFFKPPILRDLACANPTFTPVRPRTWSTWSTIKICGSASG